MKNNLFNKSMVLMLVLVLILSGCAAKNDKDADVSETSETTVATTSSNTSAAQSETKTTAIETEDTDKADKQTTDTTETEDNDKENKDNDKKDDSKILGEDALQQLSDKLADIEYSYQAVIDNSGGVVRIPDAVEGPKAIDWFQAEVMAELEKLDFEPLSENASDEEINELFKHLLKIASYDYPPIDEVERFPYVIFKEDKIDPWTNRKVEEDIKINVEIVLDASGSMANQINGVEMMTIAKDSITEVLSKMPQDANVGLRVFGHLGDNSNESKQISCGANELIHPISPLDINGIESALAPIKPTGWTSIAKSIENGASDFKDFNAEKDLNILYIITDGIETCGGNPEEVARKLKDNGTNVVLGIIGFNVNENQNAVLRRIAEAGDGYYSSAKDAQNLTVELAKIFDMSYSTYHWTTLDDALINRMQNEHRQILDFNELIAEYDAGKEESFIEMAIRAAEDAGLYPDSSDIKGKLMKMAKEREDKIRPLLMEKYNETENKSAEYLESLTARKGEIVAYIPSTTRNEKVENVLRNKGGSREDYKKEGDELKEDQQKSIDEMEKETTTE